MFDRVTCRTDSHRRELLTARLKVTWKMVLSGVADYYLRRAFVSQVRSRTPATFNLRMKSSRTCSVPCPAVGSRLTAESASATTVVTVRLILRNCLVHEGLKLLFLSMSSDAHMPVQPSRCARGVLRRVPLALLSRRGITTNSLASSGIQVSHLSLRYGVNAIAPSCGHQAFDQRGLQRVVNALVRRNPCVHGAFSLWTLLSSKGCIRIGAS